MRAYDLTTAHLVNPMGIDVQCPGLSWKCCDGIGQSAYMIHAAASEDDLKAGRLLWDSGEIVSDESLNIVYSPALHTGDRVYWQVKLRDEQLQWGEWSEPAFFEIGLLDKTDLCAKWINPENSLHSGSASIEPSQPPVSLLRREFSLEKGFTRARLYISALGMYEAWVNGCRVGDEVLTPGFTDMDRRRQYQTYDVTDILCSGDNAVGIALADGGP